MCMRECLCMCDQNDTNFNNACNYSLKHTKQGF